ncbi:MAG: zinc-dependent peptidase [Candidatus Pedobacter colombiensis]|uniref:Zinc-dependent peptidase n=1 Tax=Candidatus Pedobacter colombiensis TaxID=3121371 RepID=A0AAJ5W700_9SPHI|nr:M90 family metallopeptidase [Pedobacter sp.]WEK19149.1 MAG: zinc-dependent peptidase [Pedobacter sp.]
MNTIFFILIPLFIIVVYFILRGNIFKSKAIPSLTAEERDLLSKQVHFYQQLGAEDKRKFEAKIAAFLGYVRIEGIDLEVNPLDRILVASSAIIPVFGFDDWKYKNLSSVLLYPDTFNKDFQFEGKERNILGMVGEGYMNGQMILSRSALQRGFSNAAGKENTAIHEFVHLLDKSDGATDGVPDNLMKHEYTVPWVKMIHQEMQQIEKGKSDINPYAITNEAEFFAVVSEYFFENPKQLKAKHPQLYQILSETFLQDLASK